MKYKIFLYSLGLFLTLGVFASITQIFAQDGVNDASTAPGTGAVINDTAGIATTDDGFNLLWILPLIAIVILVYILWPRGRREEPIDEPYDKRYAGTKGGRARDELYYDEDKGEVVTGEKRPY